LPSSTPMGSPPAPLRGEATDAINGDVNYQRQRKRDRTRVELSVMGAELAERAAHVPGRQVSAKFDEVPFWLLVTPSTRERLSSDGSAALCDQWLAPRQGVRGRG
jgi:hypothetical protein